MSISTPAVETIVDDEENEEASATTNNAIETFPHVGWSEYFAKIGENCKTMGMFYAKCKICFGRKVISCAYSSTANLKRHVEVFNDFHSKYKTIFINTFPKKFQSIHRAIKTNVLENVIKKKSEHALAQNKRKISAPIQPAQKKKAITQADLNQMILEYICDGSVPFSTVENTSFQNIILIGFQNCRSPCRQTITTLLMKEFELVTTAQTEEFQKVSHVCITADGWTAHHR